MAEQYGRSSSVRELVTIARRPMFITAAFLVPVIIVAWAFVGPVTRLVVPAYAGAIPAMRWALLIPLVSSFQAINSVFNVARRQDLSRIHRLPARKSGGR